MPVTFLDHLDIMQKQQLRRHVRHARGVATLLVVQLDGQVPQRQRVVGGRDRDDAVVRRMPFDAGDLLLVEVERGDGRRRRGNRRRGRLAGSGRGCGAGGGGRGRCRAGLPLPQVPHRPFAVLGTGGEEVHRLLRPRHDVDIGGTDLDAEGGPVRLRAHVPDAHRAVGAGGGEDVAFVGRPLHVFDATGVADEGPRVRGPAAAVGARRDVDGAVVVAGDELALRDQRRPVEGVAFGFVHAEGRDGFGVLRGDDGAGVVEGGEVRGDVVDQDLGGFGHGGG